ncbi:hypothetical protein COK46_01790 [Bacillus thuringiensis]|uniref:hypothetical protein n=1 Tax=Bacillus thuringiensis TaxID=1428 RepID=UPI000BF5905A|nr:hypothetical protein [Bacillus thuringiensis]PFS24371.1 hypothetical protein COK46_01790 [Bacillus thuringiensis]
MKETQLPFTEEETTTPFELAAECTTDGNDASGRRKDCDSDISVVNAPDGFVLNDRDFEMQQTYNGTDPNVNLTWDDYVEIIPGSGLKYPTKVSLSVHARSPRGHNGQRGWNKVKISGTMINYQRMKENIVVALGFR